MSDETQEPTTPEGDGTPQEMPDDTPQEAEKTFTQADLDKLINERLKRERSKYADYANLKKAADELSQLKEAQLTETERLQKQLAEATENLSKVQSDARQSAIRAAIIAEAAKLDFNDPADAVALVPQSDISIDDDGKVLGVADAVKALAEQRKYLIKNDKQRYLEKFNPSGDTQPQKETDEQRRARIYGGSTGIFTVEQAEQHGGGVIWNEAPPKQ